MRLTFRRGVGAVATALTLLWGAGFVTMLRSKPRLDVRFPRQQPHPKGVHNLALFVHGTHVRASSYDNWVDSEHHAGFLIDGFHGGTLIEKWVSRPGDLRPWVELRWDQPAAVDKVVIHHAGTKETDAYTARKYVLRCLRPSGRGAAHRVDGNVDAIATHVLECEDAVGVRVDFVHAHDGDVTRVYEVEVWGSLLSKARR